MKFKLLTVFLLLSAYGRAQNLSIIPQPQSINRLEGQFYLNNRTTIGTADTSLLTLVGYFQKEVHKAKNVALVQNIGPGSLIDLKLDSSPQTTGAYTLDVTPEHITVSSSNKDGVFYGLMTLLQLIKNQQADNDNNICLQACKI